MIMYKIGRSLSGVGHWPGAGISTVNLHVRKGRGFGFLSHGSSLSVLKITVRSTTNQHAFEQC